MHSMHMIMNLKWYMTDLHCHSGCQIDLRTEVTDLSRHVFHGGGMCSEPKEQLHKGLVTLNELLGPHSAKLLLDKILLFYT